MNLMFLHNMVQFSHSIRVSLKLDWGIPFHFLIRLWSIWTKLNAYHAGLRKIGPYVTADWSLYPCFFFSLASPCSVENIYQAYLIYLPPKSMTKVSQLIWRYKNILFLLFLLSIFYHKVPCVLNILSKRNITFFNLN